MALLTPANDQTLRSWSIHNSYSNHRPKLIDVAQIVYQALNIVPGNPPQEQQCEAGLKNALLVSGIFGKIIRKHGLLFVRRTYYETIALALARYLLDNEWARITSRTRTTSP